MEQRFRFLWIVPVFLSILLPLSPLFPVHEIFVGDWMSHVWPVNFMGAYFKAHGHFPFTINSSEMAFLPIPLFYAHVLYPGLGFLASFCGVDLALRIPILFLFTLQFALVFWLVKTLTKNRLFSFSIAFIVHGAIYPLTNLYNRSAIPELFATLFLSCSFCCLFLVIFSTNQKRRTLFGFLGSWCFAFSLGSHPITAFFGSLFFACAVCSMIPQIMKMSSRQRRTTLALFIFAVGLAFALNSPWIYVTKLMLHQIFISTHGLGLFFYPNDIDAFTTRFSFFPRDPRVVGFNLNEVANPFLDAQINVPLLLVSILISAPALKNFLKGKNFMWSLGVFLFVATTALSLSTKPYGPLPPIFMIIQFLYRMVTYQNLSLFLVLIAALKFQNPNVLVKENYQKAVLILCVALSFIGIMVKNFHGTVVRYNPANPQTCFENFRPANHCHESRSVLEMPEGYYTLSFTSNDIPVLRSTPGVKLDKALFLMDAAKNFGEPEPLDIEVKDTAWVQTNVAAFSWNHVSVDGVDLDQNKIFNIDQQIAFQAKPGLYHLTAEFRPDHTWLTLKKWAWPTALALSAVPLFFVLL